MDFADDIVVDDPLKFSILLKGGLMRIYSGLEVILDFGVTKFSGMSLIWDLSWRSQSVLVNPSSDGLFA